MLLPRDFDWRIVTNTRRFECLFCVLSSMCRGFSGYSCARNEKNRRNFVEFWVNFPPFCTEEERIFLGEKSNWAITWKTRANSISRSRYRVYSTSGDPSSAQRILCACPIHAWVIRRGLRDSRLIWFGSCELWQIDGSNFDVDPEILAPLHWLDCVSFANRKSSMSTATEEDWIQYWMWCSRAKLENKTNIGIGESKVGKFRC